MSVSNINYDFKTVNKSSNFHSYNSNPANSNQSMDIFKSRMAEISKSADKLQEDLSKSSSRQVRQVLIQISLLLFFTLSLLSGVYLYKHLTSKAVFCSSGVSSNCLPCPSHSICENGDFACIAPYIKAGYECIEDREVIQKAYKHLSRIEKYIIDKSVERFLSDRSQFDISLEDLDQLFKESELVQEKALDLLLSGKATRLQSEYKSGTRVFLAKRPFLGVLQIIQVFCQDNLYYLVAGFIFFVYLVLKLIKVKKERVLREKAAEMFEIIKTQLKANVDDSPEHGIPEENLKDEIFSSLGGQTGKLLWPFIETLRKKDKQVSKFEIHVAGRPLMLWQWADVRVLKATLKK